MLADLPQPGGGAFAGWLVFDRFGGGYVAVLRAALDRYVQASTWIELTAAVVLANAAGTWLDTGSGR